MNGVTEPAERPFTSYTSADHARISYTDTAWLLVGKAYDAALPPRMRPFLDRPAPTSEIVTARSLATQASRLDVLAVLVCHESGCTWEEIGRALGVTRQSAHARYAEHVNGFHSDLATVLDAIAAGEAVTDVIDKLPARVAGLSLVVDTGWHAPRLDAWLAATGRLPGTMTFGMDAGALLAQLSDPASSVGYHGGAARGSEARSPRCPFTAESYDGDPGEYLVCTATQGHSGRHKLAVTGDG
ncbi:hypothetical protein Vqi01_34860 [Micromonospora qiuiae]|uniref:Uncharacterized protein n=1 Tax=Micromonospora qiuiae TaxID=502268 RepID=A0ABQ4JDV6_9ACTN|nr:hypothetical protein [Micromonospora qiuiae]GIJ28324.1 hypothetical protein Vqi01_34860 [Micromonospora qiuiae]